MPDERRWFVRTDAGEAGPYTREQLQDRFARGEISPQARVRRDGQSEWTSAVRVLSSMNSQAAPPTRSLSPPPPWQREDVFRPQQRFAGHDSKWLALTLGLVLVIGILLGLLLSIAVQPSPELAADLDKSTVSRAVPDRTVESQANAESAVTAESADFQQSEATSSEINVEQATAASGKVDSSKNEVAAPVEPIVATPEASTTDGIDPSDATDSAINEPEPSETEPRDDEMTEVADDSDEGSSPPFQTDVADGSMKEESEPGSLSSDETPAQPLPQGDPAKTTTLYQELTIQRMPQLSVLGTMLSQDLHYQILSELQVAPADSKGARQVSQTILGTRLLRADPLSQATYARSLKELEGWQFEFRVNRFGEVIDWKAGPRDGRGLSDVVLGEQSGFLVSTVLDEDGWKEVGRLSFFAPLDEVEEGEPFERQMTHDYGALGQWIGETVFRRASRRSADRYVYEHQLRHQPRDAGAPEIPGLPFKVVSIEMETRTADGSIERDVQTGQVEKVIERFEVVGKLSAETLGGVAELEFHESQATMIFLMDQNPWNRD